MAALSPTAFHSALRDYLKRAEPELWAWFSGVHAQSASGEATRLELLKTTYRLELADHPALYEAAGEALAALGMDSKVWFYQSATTGTLNASIYCLPGESHIVFTGNVAEILSPVELRAVLGHELAHGHLWNEEGGEFRIADLLIHAAAADFRAETSHQQSARLFQLYTEIYADRGAFLVTRDLPATVAALVKIATGLPEINGVAYLRQAEDIFAKGPLQTEGLSHPETFIRAKALALWTSGNADQAIQAMIEGVVDLDSLDLVGQERLTGITRRLIGQFLRPEWLHTPPLLAHARSFFPDATPATADDRELPGELQTLGPQFPKFFSAVLLDFATADPDLDDRALAEAIAWSTRCQIGKNFAKFAAKELGLKASDLKKLRASDAPAQ